MVRLVVWFCSVLCLGPEGPRQRRAAAAGVQRVIGQCRGNDTLVELAEAQAEVGDSDCDSFSSGRWDQLEGANRKRAPCGASKAADAPFNGDKTEVCMWLLFFFRTATRNGIVWIAADALNHGHAGMQEISRSTAGRVPAAYHKPADTDCRSVLSSC